MVSRIFSVHVNALNVSLRHRIPLLTRTFTTSTRHIRGFEHGGLPRYGFEHSEITSFLPGKCKVLLEVGTLQVEAPWQNKARIGYFVHNEEGEKEKGLLKLVVRGLPPGQHEVELEFDPDDGPHGRLNMWKDDAPVKGALTTPLYKPVLGSRRWAGVPGGEPVTGDQLPIPSRASRQFAPLRRIIEKDAQSHEIVLPRSLPTAAPAATADEWDKEMLQKFLERLPAELREEIEQIDSPVARAGLCLRAAEILSMAPCAEFHTLNVIRSLRPGATTVRVYDLRDTKSLEQTLPLTPVQPDGTVSHCLFPHTNNIDLAGPVLDLEYGMLPTRKALDRRNRKKVYLYGDNPEYGVSLSQGRSILFRDAPADEDKRHSWHTIEQGSSLAGTKFPGILAIVDHDRHTPLPADRRVPAPLRAANPERDEDDLVVVKGNTDYTSQTFAPMTVDDMDELFPDELPGVRLFAQEVDMVEALLRGEVPSEGLAGHICDRLLEMDPDRQARGVAAILAHFKKFRGRALTRRKKREANRDLPLTLNLLESPEDLSRIQVFVMLDRIVCDFYVLDDANELAHFRVFFGLPSNAEDAPQYGAINDAVLQYTRSDGNVAASVQLLQADGRPLSKSWSKGFGTTPNSRLLLWKRFRFLSAPQWASETHT